jgi:ribosomal protein S19
MSRSIWKPSINLNENFNNFNNKKIKITERNSIITSNFLNKKVSIYNGKVFINTFIDKSKIGYKFGEFAYSRKPCIYKTKTEKSKKGKKK